MAKLKIKANKIGLKFSVGERVIVISNDMSVEDAQLIAEQYPEKEILEFIEPKKTKSKDEPRTYSKTEGVDSLSENDISGQS